MKITLLELGERVAVKQLNKLEEKRLRTHLEGQLMLGPSVRPADVIPIARQDMYRRPPPQDGAVVAIVVVVAAAPPPRCRHSLAAPVGRRRSPRRSLRQKSLCLSRSPHDSVASIAYGEASQSARSL